MSWWELLYFWGIPFLIAFCVMMEEVGFFGVYVIVGLAACLIVTASTEPTFVNHEEIKVVNRLEFSNKVLIVLEGGETKTLFTYQEVEESKTKKFYRSYYFKKSEFGPDREYSKIEMK
jgi:hypothetical protein